MGRFTKESEETRNGTRTTRVVGEVTSLTMTGAVSNGSVNCTLSLSMR